MKKILYFIFSLFFVLNTYAISSSRLNTTYKNLNSTKLNTKDSLKLLFDKGIAAYEKHNYNHAISIWKKVLKENKNKNKKDKELGLKAKINIGAAYNAIGYHKTASQYFISVNSAQKTVKKNDTYWVNNINIGVCYMSLENYELAKKYFDQTEEITPYISFVKKLNLAKWHALNNNKSKFYALQKEISNQVSNYPMFESIWEEVQLEFLIDWKDKVNLSVLIEDLKPKYLSNNLFLKLKTNQALLLLDKKPLEKITDILNYESEVMRSNDFFLKNLYFKFLKEFYFKQNDIIRYHKFDKLCEESNEQFVKEKNMLYLEDFKAAQEMEELKYKFSEEQIKNQLIQNQLSKSDLKFRLSVLIILMSISVILLLVRNYNKNKKVQQIHILESQNKLLKKEVEKAVLSETLKETKEELIYSVLNIKKVALLKKQLENIIDDKKTVYDEKETLKRFKICLNTFFDNYRELNDLIYKKLQVDQIIEKTKIDFPNLTQKEINVIEWIVLKFTTKEIALLMDKSEKSVEYYRTLIRKKLNLSNDCSIEQYFNKIT